MKVYMSCYRDHWISPYTILDYMFFWTDWSKCSRSKRIFSLEEEKLFVEPPAWVDTWSDRLTPISHAIKWVLDLVHPEVNYVKIDRWDSWSMDHTLSPIILPMLKQLQATKHGAPFVDDEDVPEHLRSTAAEPKENEWDTDSNHFLRWDWALAEMIWAFEQKINDDSESQFFDHSECSGEPIWDPESYKKVKYDKEGHTTWQARKANGFRLFGKYYEALWD